MDDDVQFPEGTRVTVVASGPEDEIELSASEEEELLESIREAERGEVVTAEDLLRRLARYRVEAPEAARPPRAVSLQTPRRSNVPKRG